MPVPTKPKAEEEWQDTTGNIWRPTKTGDSVVGTLKSRREGKFKWANYTIETDDGSMTTVFGSAVLENRMSAIDDGERIKIIFDGMQKNTRGQDMRMYRVLHPKK